MNNTVTSIHPQRVQQLDGIRNFRDLGGYETTDGRRVRWGRVFRSAKLSKGTPAGLDALDALSVDSVFDLRTAEERGAEPSRWLRAPARVFESAKPTIRPLMDEMLLDAVDEASAVEMMKRLYRRIPELYREEFALLFRQLVEGRGPLLFHCTAGKDRTGVASALLLTMLGVPADQVAADYQLTEILLDAHRQVAERQGITGPASVSDHLSDKPVEVQLTLWRARPEFLHAGFEAIEQNHGSIEQYMTGALGLAKSDLQALREHLLD